MIYDRIKWDYLNIGIVALELKLILLVSKQLKFIWYLGVYIIILLFLCNCIRYVHKYTDE